MYRTYYGTPRLALGPITKLKPISRISIADRVAKLMIRSIGNCPIDWASATARNFHSHAICDHDAPQYKCHHARGYRRLHNIAGESFSLGSY